MFSYKTILQCTHIHKMRDYSHGYKISSLFKYGKILLMTWLTYNQHTQILFPIIVGFLTGFHSSLFEIMLFS